MRFIGTLLILVSTIVLSSIYTIVGTFNPTDTTLSATLDVLWMNETDESTSIVLFNLFPNLHKEPNPKVKDYGFSKGWIDVETVLVDGSKVDFETTETFIWTLQNYSKEDTFLVVKLPRTVEPGSSIKLEMRFKLKIPEKRSEDESCQDGFCLWRFGWYPLEVHVKDGSYDTGFVLTPHVCRASVEVPKGWTFITHEGTGVGCPLLLVKGYERLELDGNYRVSVYYQKGRRERAFVVGAMVLKALEDYSKRFGKLDYEDVNVVESPVPGLFGMTTNGLITLGDNAFTTADLIVPGLSQPLNEFLVYHEVAHLWFGVGVGIDFSKDNFLSESLAQYAALTQIENVYDPWNNVLDPDSPDVFSENLKSTLKVKSLRENYQYIYSTAHRLGLDGKVEGGHEYLNQFLPIDYSKGYFAMRSLEKVLGRDEFDSLLKKYHERFKGNVASYGDFKSLILRKHPELSKHVEVLFENPEGVDLRVIPEGGNFRIEAPEGFKYEVMLTKVDGSTETILLTGSSTLSNVSRVDLDPDWSVPDPDRFDNHFPPLISGMGKDHSPLESYTVKTPGFYEFVNASETVMCFGIGIEKFGYWSFGGLSGILMKTLGDSEMAFESVYGVFGSLESPLYNVSFWTAFNETGLKVLRADGIFAVPEVLDVGYSLKYLTSRIKIFTSIDYNYEWSTTSGGVIFSDLIKTGIYGGIGLEVFNLGEEYVPLLDVSYFPNERFDVHFQGLHQVFGDQELIAPYGMNGPTFRNFGSISVGYHFPVLFRDRINIVNILSVKGVVLGSRAGLEGGTSSGTFKRFAFVQVSLTPVMYTFLDSQLPLGLYAKFLYDFDTGNISIFYGIGAEITDYIALSLLSALRIHPPEFRIPLRLP